MNKFKLVEIETLEETNEELQYSVDSFDGLDTDEIESYPEYIEKLIQKIESLDPSFNRHLDLTNSYLTNTRGFAINSLNT